MKKYLTLFLILIVVFIQLFYSRLVYAAEKEQRTVRVGVYDNNPKIYKDAKGDIKGFWADITYYIAAKENWNLIYVHDTWENNLKRLENGEIDVMVDVAVSDERKNIYDFNNETGLISWGLFYTRKGVKLDSVMDIEGKNIAIMKSGILYSGPLGLIDTLSSFGIKADITNVDIYEDVFKLLDSGKADVGVVNYFYGITNENKYKVNRTNILIQPVELKYAFTKNSPQNKYLIGVIDAHLKEIKSNPNSIYHQSIRNNFGRFIIKEEVLPEWAKYIMITIGLLFALSLLISLMLRRYQKVLKQQVKEKMSEIEFNNVILTTQQEVSLDGILVVDEDGKILLSNKRFADIWGIPKGILESKSDEKTLRFVTDKLVNSGEFLAKVKYLYEHKDETSQDEISLNDGRMLERYSAPMFGKDNNYYGRVWYFRDISDRKKAEEKFQNKYDEMEKLYTSVIGREVKMADLKRENEELKARNRLSKI
jgi:two-component system, cell cycle sensor histidine kinase and response regulator CckA